MCSECARGCFISADIQRIGPDLELLRRKQICYIAFGILVRVGRIKADWVRAGIDIWYAFGFVTCNTEKPSHRTQLQKAYSDAIHQRCSYGKPPATKTTDRSVLFNQFLENYLAGNLITWLDPDAKLGFDKFPLLKEFLQRPLDPDPEAVAKWSIWRLCHLKSLDDKMIVPTDLDTAIGDYELPDDKKQRELLLS